MAGSSARFDLEAAGKWSRQVRGDRLSLGQLKPHVVKCLFICKADCNRATNPNHFPPFTSRQHFHLNMADNLENPIPFSEPPYLCGLPSPYYTESHRQFQKACRRFLWDNLLSNAAEWEKEGTVPEHVFATFCKSGMLLPNMPAPLPVEWLKDLGIHDILGVKVEEWDYLHTGIYCDEVRLHCSRPMLMERHVTDDDGSWPAPA